ncbi:MAG TPA: beta-ketoacyl-[acyl-carrier-protein] synthase family protein [Spirochaetia bacterium]|nr:beta-ketoacyl-[acyl-carrier-protein] synthase family protein [Spirochaetia bacterium]
MNTITRNPHETRVVITGLGTINPLGHTVAEYWDNLIKGKSGIRRAKNVDLSDFSIQIAGEIDLPDLSGYFKSKKVEKKLDRYIIFGHISGTQAIRDSGIDIEGAPHRYGSLIGTADAGIATHLENVKRIVRTGMQSVSPYFVTSAIPNTAPAYFAKEWNLQGVSFSVNSACSSSNHALGLAVSLIKMGMADAIFAGGSEAAVNESGFAAFAKIFALSDRNDSPETASRPFDKDRNGFVLSEGAGVLCLEELEHAKRRGAHIYAEISGVGFSCDAYDLVAPDPEAEGAARAMKLALESARLNPEDINLINGHATSTPLGDIAESVAINKVFGKSAEKIPVHSTKSMTGHMLGGAGTVEAIAAILALEKGIIHPTINVFEQDSAINLNVVKNNLQNGRIDHVLSNSFAFGGQNAVLVFSRFKG